MIEFDTKTILLPGTSLTQRLAYPGFSNRDMTFRVIEEEPQARLVSVVHDLFEIQLPWVYYLCREWLTSTVYGVAMSFDRLMSSGQKSLCTLPLPNLFQHTGCFTHEDVRVEDVISRFWQSNFNCDIYDACLSSPIARLAGETYIAGDVIRVPPHELGSYNTTLHDCLNERILNVMNTWENLSSEDLYATKDDPGWSPATLHSVLELVWLHNAPLVTLDT